jgi:hypothetical protein
MLVNLFVYPGKVRHDRLGWRNSRDHRGKQQRLQSLISQIRR